MQDEKELRAVYIEELIRYAQEDPRITLVEADLSKALSSPKFKAAYWEVRFETPQSVDAVFLYSSVLESRRPAGYDLWVNGQWLYTGIPSKEEPGEATVIRIPEGTCVSTLRISVQAWGKAECLGLSDIQLFWKRGAS